MTPSPPSPPTPQRGDFQSSENEEIPMEPVLQPVLQPVPQPVEEPEKIAVKPEEPVVIPEEKPKEKPVEPVVKPEEAPSIKQNIDDIPFEIVATPKKKKGQDDSAGQMSLFGE
jgi:hypothetical protein